jgi:hypothetical protein
MKNRKRETCTSGTVRDEDGNILIYSANDRGDRGNVGIIRSPVRASIPPDQSGHDPNIRAEGFRDSKKTLVLKKVALIRRFWRFTWRV